MRSFARTTSQPNIHIPAFRPKYHVEIVPGEGAFVLSETSSFVWEGEHVMEVIPLVDGRRTLDQIVAALKTKVPRDHVYKTIEKLIEAGQIEEAEPTVRPEHAAFWSEMNIAS